MSIEDRGLSDPQPRAISIQQAQPPEWNGRLSAPDYTMEQVPSKSRNELVQGDRIHQTANQFAVWCSENVLKHVGFAPVHLSALAQHQAGNEFPAGWLCELAAYPGPRPGRRGAVDPSLT